MPIDYNKLQTLPRLLVKANLTPYPTDRFQATFFADLGPALYSSPDGKRMLLVESEQSVANHLEKACWDEAADDLIPELRGLPYILVKTPDGKRLTNSVLEAHRINSEYIIESKLGEERFKAMLESELQHSKKKPINRRTLLDTVLSHDIGSIIHGCFLEEIDGRLRVTRALSGFIEASGVEPVDSGGAKVNRVEPKQKGGRGNVIYPRTHFVAKQIAAFFNLDLALLRGYGFSDEITKLLIALSLLKIRRFLTHGLRLRSFCDFRIDGDLIVQPDNDWKVPEESELLQECAELIKKVQSMFKGSNGVTEVIWSKEARPIVVLLPADAPDPSVPEELSERIKAKKATDKRPATIEIPADHGWDAEELAESLFPENEAARKAVVTELKATRIEVQDEELKFKVPKALKDKVRWSKPTKNQAGEIWIAADLGMEPQELAEALFPADEDGQKLILEAFE